MSRFLLESCRILQISANRFVSNPRRSVARLHTVHFVIRGHDELVQRFAVNPKRRRPDADADARETIPAERHRELRYRTLDAHTQVFHLRAHNLLHERDKLITAIAREEVILTQLTRDQMRYLAQHLVARLVPVSIVDVLKLIEVEHHDLESPVSTARACSFLLKTHRQVPAIR